MNIITIPRTAIMAAVALGVACASEPSPPDAAEQTASALLRSDAAFSDSASRDNLVDGLARMFSDEVHLIATGRLVIGRDSATALLRSNPVNIETRARWRPVRAGVSSDGGHGFTLGYMEAFNESDSVVSRAKYIAYWKRGADGWRVFAYKRAYRSGGSLAGDVFPPSLPSSIEPARHTQDPVASLAATERAFSDSAQRSVEEAFRFFAAPDANHFGGPQDIDFLTGKDAIARGAGGGGGPGDTRVRWSPTRTIVADGGDLGVNLGFIIFSEPGKAEVRTPFMAIWRRMASGDWRFVAE